ncbi:MAG: hypothetical protein Q9218_007886 [Villophora microphyllina]
MDSRYAEHLVTDFYNNFGNSFLFRESILSRIELPEENPILVAKMTEFLYTRKYDLHASLGGSFDPTTTDYSPDAHIALANLGEKYAVPALSSYVINLLCNDLLENRDNKVLLQCMPFAFNTSAADANKVQSTITNELMDRAGDLLNEKKSVNEIVDLMQENRRFCMTLAIALLQTMRDLREMIDGPGEEQPKP